MATMNQSITNISVDVLKVHPRNAEFFDDISGEEYDRFKKSIQDDGLLSPLIVAPDMTIISGHQRLKACKELGFKSVPVIIKDDLEDEDEKLKKLIAANFGRLKNDPIKQARVYQEYEKLSGVGGKGRPNKMRNNSALKQDEIAKELGVDVSTIQNLKRLLTLAPELQELISQGAITPTTGFKVLSRLSEEEQIALLSKLPSAEKFTQAQVQQYIDQIQNKEKEIDGMKEEMVEQQRAINAATDSEEYLRMKKAKEDALQEARDNYEKWQTEKKKSTDILSNPDVIKAVTANLTVNYEEQIATLNTKVNELEAKKTPKTKTVTVIPADYDGIKARLAKYENTSSDEHVMRTSEDNRTAEQRNKSVARQFIETVGSYLPNLRGIVTRIEFCSTLSPAEKSHICHDIAEINQIHNKIINTINGGNEECKIA
jgi:ParB family chromosome partitioning protein